MNQEIEYHKIAGNLQGKLIVSETRLTRIANMINELDLERCDRNTQYEASLLRTDLASLLDYMREAIIEADKSKSL
jgi:hypothetical protein